MDNIDLSHVTWRKSSKSSANGQCVEVAFVKKVLVRDSKRPEGGMLALTSDQWGAFVRRLEDDEFNPPE